MAGFGDGYVGTATDALKIRRYQKKREDALKDMELRKKKAEESSLNAGLKRFDAGRGDKIEAAFKQETMGLMTRDQYISTKSTIEAKLDELERKKRKDKEEEEVRVLELKRKKHREKTAKMTSKLSFDIEEEEQDDEEIEIVPKKKKAAGSVNGKEENGHSNGSSYMTNPAIGKCPEVDTSFLPDRVREQREMELREELKKEWIRRQEEIKKEGLEVVYSYWDGAGHRRKLKVKKGDTIGSFLELVRKQLEPDFRELKLLSTEKLLYVKEDLIIPHHYSFYELIVNKARGKSGPLFHFDVHEDVRMEGDHRVEKDESHAGKVVERYWYEKNRHIFPANRWEVYDPTKNRNDKYTVHDWNKEKS